MGKIFEVVLSEISSRLLHPCEKGIVLSPLCRNDNVVSSPEPAKSPSSSEALRLLAHSHYPKQGKGCFQIMEREHKINCGYVQVDFLKNWWGNSECSAFSPIHVMPSLHTSIPDSIEGHLQDSGIVLQIQLFFLESGKSMHIDYPSCIDLWGVTRALLNNFPLFFPLFIKVIIQFKIFC